MSGFLEAGLDGVQRVEGAINGQPGNCTGLDRRSKMLVNTLEWRVDEAHS